MKSWKEIFQKEEEKEEKKEKKEYQQTKNKIIINNDNTYWGQKFGKVYMR